jgi:hypothetical protein
MALARRGPAAPAAGKPEAAVSSTEGSAPRDTGGPIPADGAPASPASRTARLLGTLARL